MLPMTTSPLERLGTLGVHPRLPGPVVGPLLMLVRAYHFADGDVNGAHRKRAQVSLPVHYALPSRVGGRQFDQSP